MTEPTGASGGHEGEAADLECPRCGSPASPGQDYCLECGARLPPAVTAAGLQGGARESLLTVLVAFLVAVLAAAAVVAVQVTRDEGEHPFLVATNEEGLTEPEGEREPPLETALPPEEEDEELPFEEEPLEEEPEAVPPQQQELIEWPEGTEGFTVVLASLPSAAGREAATARARQARDAGLSEVGVLVSSEFASLQPGYFVVFSGVYEARADADAAVAAARDAGHPDAYVGRIAR